ncbi:hypothetical protein MBRA1_001703 [Malassezia brasiliensis]|uniref:SEC7 domain-containing protein n=1 Tax=Malassezia brasiliensis TaxID=1821822 RepID=A0AAF0DTB9_9BASI|nr:hypothetical protein MBRA1_001703 [Malassezia brasiliensis]
MDAPDAGGPPRAPVGALRRDSHGLEDGQQADTSPSYVRLDAIAKLRRAASQREIRRVSPRRLRVRPEEAVPTAVSPTSNAGAVPSLVIDGNGAHDSDMSEPRSTPWLSPSTSGDVPRAQSLDQLTTPHADEGPALPSLDQLRRKILQERKKSGLSRSASASATSRVARAYTMQKLLGATTPMPYNDMFAFIRSVNDAHTAAPGDESVSADVSLESAVSESETTAEAAQEESTPPRNAKRATLMRSVSAREVARMHMFQKINKRERAAGDAKSRRGASPIPPTTPALPPEAAIVAQRAVADSPRTPRTPLWPDAGNSSRSARSSPAEGRSGEATAHEIAVRRRAPVPPVAVGSVPSSAGEALLPHSPMVRTDLVHAPPTSASSRMPHAYASANDAPTASSTHTMPLPAWVSPPAPAPASASVPLPATEWRSPSTADGVRRARDDPATLSAFSDSSSTHAHASQRDAPNDSPEMLSMLQDLSSQLDAEAREARARRMRGKGTGYLARAVSTGGSAAPSVQPGIEVLGALGKVATSPPSAPTPGVRLDGVAPGAGVTRSGTMPSRTPTVGLGIQTPGAAPSGAAHWRSASLSQDKPLPGLPSERAAPAPPAPLGGLAPPIVLPPGQTAAPYPARLPVPATETASGVSRASFESNSSDRTDSPTHRRAPEPRREGRGPRLFGSLRRKTSRSRLAERSPSHATQGGARSVPTTPPRSPRGAPTRAVVCARDDTQVPAALRTVVLPVDRAMLARLTTEARAWGAAGAHVGTLLARSVPGEVPYADALDPPRRLLRVVPVLQSADEAYVKLRYLFLFTDVLLLVKPVHVPTQPAELSAFILQRLHQPPDLYEPYVPIAALPLCTLRLGVGAAVRAVGRERDRACAVRHLRALHMQLAAALPSAAHELRGTGGADATACAQVLFLLPELDRASVSLYLYDTAHRAVLDAYVAQHAFDGVPLEAALRMLLVDLRFPTRAGDVEALLRAFAAHWVQCNQADLAHDMSRALALELARALVALNDALHAPDAHAAPGLAPHFDAHVSLEQFVRTVRAHDVRHAWSDRAVHEAFLAIKTHPLAQASTHAPRRIVFDAMALAEGLVVGVPSASITVALDAPDPHVRIKLLGDALYMDPPVLTFAHSATAEFTVCSTAPGEHNLAFVRVGAHAPLYPPTAEARAPWRALPRTLPLVSERHTTRPALTLHTTAPDAPTSTLQLYLADAAAAHHVVRLLEEQLAALGASERDASRSAAERLADRVLATGLGIDAGKSARHAAAPATGQALVRTVREHSLLLGLLGESGFLS